MFTPTLREDVRIFDFQKRESKMNGCQDIYQTKSLTVLGVVVCDNVAVEISTDRLVNIVSDKFISFSVDPQYLLAENSSFQRDDLMCMANSLSPAYIRFAGPSTYNNTIENSISKLKSNLDKLIFDAGKGETEQATEQDGGVMDLERFKKFLGWIRAANFTPFLALNNAERLLTGNWNPKMAIRVLAMVDSFYKEECVWQVGYECSGQSPQKYFNDVKTFKLMLDAFEFRRNGKWKIASADMSKCIADNPKELKNFLTLSSDILDSVVLNSNQTEVLDTLNDSDKDNLKNVLKEAGVGLMKTTTQNAPLRSDEKAVSWLNTLGRAAQNGYAVVFKTLEREDWTKTSMTYYVSLLHKKLVGSRVLQLSKPSQDKDISVFAHCASLPSGPISGGVTVFATNPGDKKTSVSIRLGVNVLDGEIMQYVLYQKSNGKIVINGREMQNEADLLPVVNKVKPFKTLTVILPPKSVGFWVVSNANVPLCSASLSIKDIVNKVKTKKPHHISHRVLDGISTVTRNKRSDISDEFDAKDDGLPWPELDMILKSQQEHKEEQLSTKHMDVSEQAPMKDAENSPILTEKSTLNSTTEDLEIVGSNLKSSEVTTQSDVLENIPLKENTTEEHKSESFSEHKSSNLKINETKLVLAEKQMKSLQELFAVLGQLTSLIELQEEFLDISSSMIHSPRSEIQEIFGDSRMDSKKILELVRISRAVDELKKDLEIEHKSADDAEEIIVSNSGDAMLPSIDENEYTTEDIDSTMDSDNPVFGPFSLFHKRVEPRPVRGAEGSATFGLYPERFPTPKYPSIFDKIRMQQPIAAASDTYNSYKPQLPPSYLYPVGSVPPLSFHPLHTQASSIVDSFVDRTSSIGKNYLFGQSPDLIGAAPDVKNTGDSLQTNIPSVPLHPTIPKPDIKIPKISEILPLKDIEEKSTFAKTVFIPTIAPHSVLHSPIFHSNTADSKPLSDESSLKLIVESEIEIPADTVGLALDENPQDADFEKSDSESSVALEPTETSLTHKLKLPTLPALPKFPLLRNISGLDSLVNRANGLLEKVKPKPLDSVLEESRPLDIVRMGLEPNIYSAQLAAQLQRNRLKMQELRLKMQARLAELRTKQLIHLNRHVLTKRSVDGNNIQKPLDKYENVALNSVFGQNVKKTIKTDRFGVPKIKNPLKMSKKNLKKVGVSSKGYVKFRKNVKNDLRAKRFISNDKFFMDIDQFSNEIEAPHQKEKVTIDKMNDSVDQSSANEIKDFETSTSSPVTVRMEINKHCKNCDVIEKLSNKNGKKTSNKIKFANDENKSGECHETKLEVSVPSLGDALFEKLTMEDVKRKMGISENKMVDSVIDKVSYFFQDAFNKMKSMWEKAIQ